VNNKHKQNFGKTYFQAARGVYKVDNRDNHSLHCSQLLTVMIMTVVVVEF